MNCSESREAFSDLCDGTLSGLRAADLQRHLDGCPECRAEAAAFRRTLQALGEMGEEEPPSGFAARVVRQIEEPRWWQRVVTPLMFPLRVKLPIHAAALVVLGLAGLWVSERSPELQRATVDRAPGVTERVAPEAARPPAPPSASKTTESEQPAAPVPTTAAPEDSTPSGAGAGTAEPHAATRTDTHTVQQPRAKAEAVPPTVPPALPQLDAAAESARSQTGPAAPDARAKTESTPRQESGGSVMQRSTAALGRRSADELFASSAAEFAAERYAPAIDSLRSFLAQHANDGRAADARFLLADAYRALGRYAEADAEFEAFLHRHPSHPRGPAALYRRGEIRLLLGDPSGCTTLRDALNRHPDARESASARETLTARCP